MIELKEGWCSDTEKLRRIIISPFNGQFIFKEDKYLIGKSNQNNDEFDKLLFVRRDIKKISIPQNIKIIESFSFSDSKIEEIFIPPSVTKICENAFYGCENLRKVEIPTNSNLQTIEKCAFSKSDIEKISIPQSVTKICEHAFSYCDNLRKVEIPTNSNLQTIEKYAFSGSKIEEIFIPQSVTKICEHAFYFCTELIIIEISEESQLKSISISSFEKCQEHMIIMIPSSLKELIKINKY